MAPPEISFGLASRIDDPPSVHFGSSTCQRTATKLVWILPTVAAMLALTGCAAEERDTPLATAASSPRTSPTAQSETEEVERSYIAFLKILDGADSLPAGERRQQLSLYMTDPQLAQAIKRIQEMKKDNVSSYGSVVPHVRHVEINGSEARLLDCQDSSNAGNMNSRTGKKIDRGIDNESVTAYLSKGSDGQWRVTKTVSRGRGC